MKNRLEIASEFLTPDGFICVHLDDTEMAYCKVLMDEIFGRSNYRNTIALTTNDPSGFKATGESIFSTANYILVFSKGQNKSKIRKLYIESGYDSMYNKVLLNKVDHYSKWKWVNINEYVAKENGFTSTKEAKKKLGDEFEILIEEFALKNADRVFRTAAIKGGARQKRIDTIEKSKQNKDKVLVHPNDDIPDFYILNGEGIVFYKNKIFEIDGMKLAGTVITDVWTDISWTGIANEGGVTLKNGKKPEKLMARIIEMLTSKNEIVMDYNTGSGTTIAVAHKLGRRYIGIEQLDYYENDSFVRLKNVINGDTTGVSKAYNWKGGGSFVYMELNEWNEQYMNEIQKADNIYKLLNIYEKMKKETFFRYEVDLSQFDEKEFKALPLKEQKQVLYECLDKNHLYVNLSEIDDTTYKISAEDKRLSKEFYKTVL
jgi:adenine-specific DNA-methyltransferase